MRHSHFTAFFAMLASAASLVASDPTQIAPSDRRAAFVLTPSVASTGASTAGAIPSFPSIASRRVTVDVVRVSSSTAKASPVVTPPTRFQAASGWTRLRFGGPAVVMRPGVRDVDTPKMSLWPAHSREAGTVGSLRAARRMSKTTPFDQIGRVVFRRNRPAPTVRTSLLFASTTQP